MSTLFILGVLINNNISSAPRIFNSLEVLKSFCQKNPLNLNTSSMNVTWAYLEYVENTNESGVFSVPNELINNWKQLV